MSAAATDYIGMWYRARARLGVDDRIEFIFIDPASGQRRTVALRHRDYDGVAGILVAAREVGMRMPMVPSGKRRKAPPFWQRWQSPAESREPAELQWRRFGVADSENNAPLVQWLNPQQTRALYQRAHQQKVSVNSLLLLALHRAVSDTLLVKGQPGSWCFPVNMRNAVTVPRQEMNLSSAFYLTVDENDTPSRIDRTIRQEPESQRALALLASGPYWALDRSARSELGVQQVAERSAALWIVFQSGRMANGFYVGRHGPIPCLPAVARVVPITPSPMV